MKIDDYLKTLAEELRPPAVALFNENCLLREEVNSLRRSLFGRSSEKHIVPELILPKDCLFNEAEALVEPETPAPAKEIIIPEHTRKVGKRKPLPEHLARVDVRHEIPENERICPADGTVLEAIGEEIVEKLELEPAKLFVNRHIYVKYGCPCCKTGVAQAPAQPSVLPKALFEPGLLAYVVSQKFLYSMPLYRMEKMFEQMGVDLPRTTIARWVIAAGAFLTPLWELMKKEILSKKVIHCDETTIQVLKELGKKAESKSYMWAICTSEYDFPAVCFEYFSSRAASCAESLLQDFQGHLHVDGYAGYNAVASKKTVVRVACWAHVRRKFEDAKVSGAKTGTTLAEAFLALIQELFMHERDWKTLSTQERLDQRKEHSQALVDKIWNLYEQNCAAVPDKSKIGRAIGYLHGEWQGLLEFLSNGSVSLSNNRIENFIRPFAVGRKNWLFADSVEGAKSSAVLYSVVVTAKENGLDVYSYLKNLFTELPKLLQANPDADLTAFLPWNAKPLKA